MSDIPDGLRYDANGLAKIIAAALESFFDERNKPQVSFEPISDEDRDQRIIRMTVVVPVPTITINIPLDEVKSK